MTETQALLEADKELLSAVDYGERLSEMQQRFDDASRRAKTSVDQLRVRLAPHRLRDPRRARVG